MFGLIILLMKVKKAEYKLYVSSSKIGRLVVSD